MSLSVRIPRWLVKVRILLQPAYRRSWKSLAQRSRVTGTARESRIVCSFLGYNLVVHREHEDRTRQ